jgi:hypothetical protein
VALRHLGDQLKLKGEHNVNTLASALLWSYRLNIIEATDSEEGVTSIPAHLRATTRQMFGLLAENPDLRESVKRTGVVRQTIKMRSGVAAALHYRFTLLDGEDCDNFFARLQDGADLKSTNPIYHLRQMYLTQMRSPREKQKDWRECALVIRAWNIWRDGDTVRTKGLRWIWGAKGKEKFPLPQ